MDRDNSENIFDPAYVEDLFDRCSSSYRTWSAVSSFGMVGLWRRVCIRSLPDTTNPSGDVVDLMAGTGEVWPHLLKRFPATQSITAIDSSKRMHDEAVNRLHAERSDRCTHLKANVLETKLPSGIADSVVSTFGLKTFNLEQQRELAKQVSRLLKVGGTFSFIEASDPVGWWMRPFYRFYLDTCLPLVEKFALRGAQDFSMIGTYTKHFANCDEFADALRSEGLMVTKYKHFFGCATGVYGIKP